MTATQMGVEMIDRAEVERIRKNGTVATGSGMDMWLPPEQIAELCRVYLAVLDAPIVTLSRADVDAWNLPDTASGKRVRLVTDAEAK